MPSPDARSDPRKVIEEPRNRTGWYFLVASVAGVVVWGMQQQSAWEPTSAQLTTDTADRAGGRSTASKRTDDQRGAHPARGDLRTLFSADDYPAAAQRAGEEGTVQAALAVDTVGDVASCTVIRSSGHSSLDDATCSILQRRAHFIPARDMNGAAVPDRVTTPPIVWRLEG